MKPSEELKHPLKEQLKELVEDLRKRDFEVHFYHPEDNYILISIKAKK